MVEIVEKALYISLDHIPKPPKLQLKGQVSDRVPGALADSIPITDVQKLLFIDGVPAPSSPLVARFYLRGQEFPRAFFPIVFWNVCPSDQRFIGLLLSR